MHVDSKVTTSSSGYSSSRWKLSGASRPSVDWKTPPDAWIDTGLSTSMIMWTEFIQWVKRSAVFPPPKSRKER